MRLWREMYFWNVKSLANDFKENKITERQKMRYYLFVSILIECILQLHNIMPNTTHSKWSISYFGWIYFGMSLLICLLGTIWCYQANHQGDDQDFISRMVCLSQPIGIRLVVISIPIFLIEYIIFPSFEMEKSLSYNVFNLLFKIALDIAPFVWIRSYLLYISGVTTPPNIETLHCS